MIALFTYNQTFAKCVPIINNEYLYRNLLLIMEYLLISIIIFTSKKTFYLSWYTHEEGRARLDNKLYIIERWCVYGYIVDE